MKGFIIKDLLNLKKSFQTMIFLFAAFLIFSISMKTPTYLASMITLMLTMTSVSSFTYDDYSKWEKFGRSLPVTKKQIVLSKYLLTLIMALAGSIISTVSVLIWQAFNSSANLLENLCIVLVMFSVTLIFTSIAIPLIYKFGVEKYRLINLAIFGGIFLLFMFVFSVYDISQIPESDFFVILLCLPVLALLFTGISYTISYRIYDKKEL